jgi:hypothetical protein
MGPRWCNATMEEFEALKKRKKMGVDISHIRKENNGL